MVSLFSAKRDNASFGSFFGDIASRLVGMSESEIASRLDTVMHDVGQRYGVDRVVIRWLPTDDRAAAGRPLEKAVGWRRDGKPIPDYTPEDVPWAIEKLRSGEAFYANNLDQVPSQQDRRALRTQGVRSVCGLPMRIDDDVIGAFTLANERPFKFGNEMRDELESLTRLIANTYWTATYRSRVRASEARYRAVVQDQSDFIVRWRPEREITWVNDRMCEYLGRSADDLLGHSELLFMTEDEWREYKKDLSALTPENPTFEHGHEWVRPDGETAWNEWTVRGIFDENGELAEVQSVGRDITERKLAERAVARQAAFQARLADITSILLNAPAREYDAVLADVQARIGEDYGFDHIAFMWFEDELPGLKESINWLPGGRQPEPYSSKDLPFGHSRERRDQLRRIDNVDDMSDEEHADQATIRRLGLSSLLIVPMSSKDRFFGRAGFAYREQRDWDENTIEELRLITNAITGAAVRRWSLQQIEARQKDLERSQRVAKVGSYRLQATRNKDDSHDLLNILGINLSEQALEIFDIEPQQDPRETVMLLLSRIHPDDEPRVRETWRKTLESGGEHTIEYRVVRHDGSIIHVQSKEQFDGADDNGVITFFGTYKDITEWVEANRHLQTALSRIEELKDQLQAENILLRDEVRAAHGFEKIIGSSSKLRRVLEAVRQVAPTNVTVLICGETGTGKELVAQSIHDVSDRKSRPMISVNCAALSSELIESELFGHEKGAFTGAHARRQGRFEIADGGTLFLDEIGEMSGDLQAKLLRVIQEGEFERLGGSETLKTDVRLIAATNRDLKKAMDSGDFRADLYYRINAFPIDLPPLRERKEDIPLLAEHFVRKHAAALGKDVDSISSRTLGFLQEQDWPGNIREMESTILRALISTNGKVVDFIGDSTETRAAVDDTEVDALSLLAAQRKHIIDVLTRSGWVIEGKKGAAQALGLAPSSLRSKMKRLNISREG